MVKGRRRETSLEATEIPQVRNKDELHKIGRCSSIEK